MSWEEAASLHGGQASLELDVVGGEIVRARYQNLTDRAMHAELFLNMNKGPQTFSVRVAAGTPSTVSPIPPSFQGYTWAEVGFTVRDE